LDSDDGGETTAPQPRRPIFGFEALDAETEDDELDPEPNGSPTEEQRSASALEASGEEDADEPGLASSEKKTEPNEKAKKKPRRAKTKGKNKTSDGVDGSAGAANALRCSLCRLTFTSGNALHKHLKEAHSGTHKKKR
jgi:DnaJ family protein A protein 5